MDRAYSVLQVKALNEEQRVITGVATTPSTDRMGDIVEPLGITFENPLPLLWQHDRDKPIGLVKFDKPTAKGVTFTAELADVREEGALKSRIDEAWQSVKAGLVRGVSIGFRSKEHAWMDDNGIHFIKTEVVELSLVTIPANAEATINTIKSIDTGVMAALGRKDAGVVRTRPGVSGVKSVAVTAPKSKATSEKHTMKTTAEQIAEFKATRLAKSDEMESIMSKAGEDGSTLDAEQSERYDTLESEVQAIDKHLERLQKLQKSQIATAKPVVEDVRMQGVQIPGRALAVVRSVKNEEPGVGFARFALAMYAGKGNPHAAKDFAEHRFSDDARLQSVMKAAVASGTTTSPTWAGNLVDYQNLTSEFIEYLRPRTIIGQFGATGVGGIQIPSLRRVPFNVRIPGKTAAGRANWVGEGYRKPATSSAYAPAELKWAKIAAFSVITDELDRFSDPSVQLLVRDDLAEAVVERADEDFVDPLKAAGTGAMESPASITNGVTPIPSSGGDADAVRADISALWETADATNMPGGSAVYITDSRTARALSDMRNPLGQAEYTAVTPTGGSINGVPLLVSNYVPADTDGSLFILAFASEIYLADDGMVNIDISREATVFLDDAAATQTPTAAQLVSLWQTNQLGIRAERYIRWQKRRPQAVAYLSGVNWGVAS